jgi:2'-5' RNA ligase
MFYIAIRDSNKLTERVMQDAFDFYRDKPVRRRRPDRLFFGLFPDGGSALQASRFGRRFLDENHLQGTPLKTERLHVSLHHVGDYERLPTKFVFAARQAGQAVSVASFEVTFRFITTFDSRPEIDGQPLRRPLVLLGESGGLHELHKRLGVAMTASGLRVSEMFLPHMTLSYGPESVPLQEIEPIRVLVRRFVLIHSKLGLTEYETIDSWPLRVH